MDYRNRKRAPRRPRPKMNKIESIIIDIQRQLRDSIQPMNIQNLNAFERKRIHSFFDNKPEYKTKTYRVDDGFVFRIYPVGNLKKFVEKKAKEAIETGNPVQLPAMSSFERFIIHDHLKDWEGIETTSYGEDENRYIEIHPKRFGRTLKKIIRKIKIF